MEHALPFDPVRGWRTAAMVAAGVATLELVVLVAGGLALAGKPFWKGIGETAPLKPRAAAAVHKAPAPLPSSVPHLARARTVVLVLNGNGRQGAAAAEAALVRGHGYRIGAVGNAAKTGYGRSVVMYRTGFRGEAVRLAHDLRVKIVGPLDGLRPAALRRSQVVIVVGS
jgi:hypothetical protein